MSLSAKLISAQATEYTFTGVSGHVYRKQGSPFSEDEKRKTNAYDEQFYHVGASGHIYKADESRIKNNRGLSKAERDQIDGYDAQKSLPSNFPQKGAAEPQPKPQANAKLLQQIAETNDIVRSRIAAETGTNQSWFATYQSKLQQESEAKFQKRYGVSPTSPKGIAIQANEATAGIEDTLKALGVGKLSGVLSTVGDFVNPAGAIVRKGIESKTGLKVNPEDVLPGAIAGTLNLPMDLMADAQIAIHPESSLEERAKAAANLILKTAPVEILQGSKGVVGKAVKTLRAGGPENARIAQAIEDTMKSGVSQQAVEDALRTKIQARETPGPTNQVTKPKTTFRENIARAKTPATGLANQVLDRKAIEGVISEVEKTKGKGAEAWQKIGKEAVDSGKYDPEQLAQRIGKGEEELTGEKVGALLEGQRKLENAVNNAAPGEEYIKAKSRLDEYLANIQQGKGRWSDVGRALQAGSELDTGNFAKVIQEVERRGGKVNEKLKAQFEDLTNKHQEAQSKIADLEKKLAEEQAKATTSATSKRAPRFSKEELDAELDDLLKEFSQKTSKLSAGIDPSVLPVVGKIAINYMKRGVNTLDAVYESVKTHFQDLTYDEFVQGIDAATTGKKQTRTALQEQINALKQEAKSSSKAQAKIKELQAQLDSVDVPTMPSKQVKVMSAKLEDLKAQKELLRRQVLAKIQNATTPLGKKVLKEGSGLVRGAILGSDFGVATRQGLFAWARPGTAVKALGKAGKALIKEENLIKVEKDILERRINGQLVDPIRKRAGLQITDTLSHPEELVVGKLLQKIPFVGKLAGKPLERAQLAFINTVRSELFDYGVKHGFSESELKARAQFINSATGRSNIKNVPDFFSAVMTSPRYEASRWEVLAAPFKNAGIIAKDLAAGKGLNRGALQNVQDMAVTAGSIYGLFKTAELSGYQVNWDPKSGDFLKMRRGDEVWDVSAGIAPRLRDVLRAYVAATNPEYDKNVGDVIRGAAVRTISPALRMPVTQLSVKAQESQGRTVGGKGKHAVIDPISGYPVGHEDEGFQTIMPLIIQSMKQALEEEGPGAALSAGAKEFVGGSINRYPAKKAR